MERLRRFLYPKDPAATKRAVKAILEAIKGLREFPRKGVPQRNSSPDRELRELHIMFSNRGYVVSYQIIEQVVVILEVWHMREDREREP